MKKIVTATATAGTLARLIGDNACEELKDLVALYELIDKIEDDKQYNKEYEELISWLKVNDEINERIIDAEIAYHNSIYDWFNDHFIIDYDNALAEIKRKENIIRIALEASYKHVSLDVIYDFFNMYDLTNEEITRFWIEYYR